MEDMFHKIYKSNTTLNTLESIGFHTLEEAGEVGRAIIDIYSDHKIDVRSLKQKQHALCDEIGEVFAWLCSLTLKVRNDAETFDKYLSSLMSYRLPNIPRTDLADYIGLEQILWVRYRNESEQYYCPYCRLPLCECELKFMWETKNIEISDL